MSKFGILFPAAVMVFFLIVAGGNWPGYESDISVAAESTTGSNSNVFKENKEKFKKKFQESLAELDKKLSQFQQSIDQKTQNFRQEAKENWKETKGSLNKQFNLAKKKLQDLEKVPEKSWGSFKNGVDNTLSKLRETYEKAVSKFKGSK